MKATKCDDDHVQDIEMTSKMMMSTTKTTNVMIAMTMMKTVDGEQEKRARETRIQNLMSSGQAEVAPAALALPSSETDSACVHCRPHAGFQICLPLPSHDDSRGMGLHLQCQPSESIFNSLMDAGMATTLSAVIGMGIGFGSHCRG
jgi:hypothetical protein